MNRETLYPNINHFTLTREMPSANIGDDVIIVDADSQYLRINEIILPFDFAKKYPEWFNAVTKEEHYNVCKENTINWFMNKGRTREQAEKMFETME
jgi:hypothetical protein